MSNPAPNPNRSRITDAEWAFWLEAKIIIPGVRLGGIWANKRGYHNTVENNKLNWPDDYSIRFTLDRVGPRDKARAIDLTMSTAEMKKRTEYLRRAALHPQDNRLRSVREFIGTLDGTKVYCLIRDANGVWTFDGGRSLSHLWHEHVSFFTLYCNNWDELRNVLTVFAGMTWEEWLDQENGDEMNSTELKHFIRNEKIGWTSSSQATRMVAWGTEGLTIQALLNYTFEASQLLVSALPSDLVARLDTILAAAQDDDNTTVILPPEAITELTNLRDAVDAVPARLREVFADAGTE